MARPRRAPQRKETGVKGARILVVEARYYEDIADMLLRGAKRVLKDAGATFDLVFGVAMRALFLGDQRLPVCDRDLIVVRMDFRKRQEAVAIAAEIDESRLQRRLYPGNLGEIDIAFDLLVIGRFKVEFLNPVALEHRHPSFLLVARIDKHARGHYKFSRRAQA